MATSFNEILSVDTFDLQCSRCCKKNNTVKSEKFCLECQQHLCFTCLELHNSFHDDHNLQDPANSSQDQLPTRRCPKHQPKVLEMFCIDHDEVVCNSCVSIDHRSCASVINISSKIQHIFDHNTLGKVKTDLQKLSPKFRETKSTGKELLKILNREKDENLSAIDVYVETLVAMIQKLGEKARRSLHETYKMEEDKLQNIQKECESAEQKIQLILKQFEYQNQSKAQSFVNMKEGQKLIHHVKMILQKFAQYRSNPLPSFDKNGEIENYLANIQTLGSVSKQSVLYKWKKKDIKDVKMKSDSNTCSIHGFCLLSDGSVLLSDYSNKKLKRLEQNLLTLTAHCDLSAHPRGVCCINQQEAAVCLDNNTIQFISLSNMTQARSIKLNHECYGIDYHDNKLYISNKGKGIVLYNIEGTLLQSVNLGLTYTRNVVFGKLRDKFYITDLNEGIVCVDISLKEQFRLKGPEFTGCLGVCADHTGSVFVCGYSSNNVVQMTETGRPLGEVVSKCDGIHFPLSMIWDSGRKRLYVAGYSDTVTIFEA